MSASKSKKSRHKTPPDQSVAGPSRESKGHRARRLEFAAKKPLTGKKFYLELTGRQKLQHAKLKADIEELGGVVEQFLSKELACVISDRAEAREGERSKVMPSGTSPAVSTPSPFHQAKDITPNAADSPSNVSQDSRVVTRGQAIVQKATKSQMYGSTDVLGNARKLHIPIKHLDVLMKYLSREKDKLKLSGRDKKKGSKDGQGVKGKERQLTKPFLKGEDVSRRFRPIHKEFKTWPRILLDTRKGSCPYDPTTRNESNPQEAERTQDRPDASQKTPDVRNKDTSRSQSLSRRVMSKAAKDRGSLATKNKASKKGFCEFCNVKYNSLEKHLQSDQHKQLVGEKNNYFNLDSMIAEGPNLSRFLEDCARFQTPGVEDAPQPVIRPEHSGSEDDVLLLSVPTPMKQQGSPSKRRKNKTKPHVDGVRNLCRDFEETPPPAVDGNDAVDPGMEDRQRKEGPCRSAKAPSKSPRKRYKSPKKRADKSDRDTPAEEFGAMCSKDAEIGAHVREQRLNCAVDGGGDAPDKGVDEAVSDNHVRVEHPAIVDRLADAGEPPGQGSPSAPGASGERRRQSGGRRSLSLQPRKSMTVQTAPQGLPEGSSADTASQGDVLRGVAGEEEPAPLQSHAEEVLITRVLRIDRDGDENDDVQPCRTVHENSVVAVDQVEQPATGSNVHQERASGSVIQGPAAPSENVLQNGMVELRAKRGSQAVSSPTSQKLSSKRKRRRLIADDEDLDDVFVNDDLRLCANNDESLPKTLSAERNKNSARFKRKSRRSHGDAPPRKIRGSSVAVESTEKKGDTGGSPQVREPQPRIPALLEKSHSSDDFQPVKMPPTRGSKNSGKSTKKSKASGDKTMSDDSQKSPDVPRVSLGNNPSTSQHSAADSNTSELDFHIGDKAKGTRIKESTLDSSKRNRRKKSRGKHKDVIANGASNDDRPADGNVEHSQNEGEVENGLNGGTNRKQNGGADNDKAQENNVLEGDNNPRSLELVFRSDLGREESSFLGFSQEEINDTISRNESFKQVQEDSRQLTQHLEKAALGVYCMPSSDPPAGKDDDDRSSVGSFGEFTIGLVLQKVDSFPSDGSEWEENVTGFMEKLDTQLEIKRRRESELSTLPSPNFHKSVLAQIEKENQRQLHRAVGDFGSENPVFAGEVSNEAEQAHSSGALSNNRRRSARIQKPIRPVTRSTPESTPAFSGMCSPSKKRKTPSSAKGESMGQTDSPGSKQALRELSSNQLPMSPQQSNRAVSFSTPKRTRRNLQEIQGSPKSPSTQHIVLPPGTPQEVQKEIVDNYVHDDDESEVVFPKFSSPAQKGSIFSPVRHRVRRKRVKRRHHSMSCLGHRDVQSSPIRPTYMRDWLPGDGPSSARKALFMKGKVKHIKFASPRRRSKSVSHSPSKASHFLTFLNELKAGLSPVFYTFKKPHFSLRILQPSVRRNCCRTRLSRSLLALNLSLPANFDLRIYEFHDDDSMDEDNLDVSPLPSEKMKSDQFTQTPPSSRKVRKMKPRRLTAERKQLTKNLQSKDSPAKSAGQTTESVECVEESSGLRSVRIQASSPDIDSFFDMPADYFL